jgi:rhodanese-related sulfurtransferase
MARITADELYQMQEAGENPFVLDLRSQLEFEQDSSLIRGALHMSVDEVHRRHVDIPRDRDVILYCSCPNEVTSARVALLLRRKGVSRVRPLLGGIDVWRRCNYPTELRIIGGPDAESKLTESGTPPGTQPPETWENQPAREPDQRDVYENKIP